MGFFSSFDILFYSIGTALTVQDDSGLNYFFSNNLITYLRKYLAQNTNTIDNLADIRRFSAL